MAGIVRGVWDRNRRRISAMGTPSNDIIRTFLPRPAPLASRLNEFSMSIVNEAKTSSSGAVARMAPSGPGWKFGNRFKDHGWAQCVEGHFKASGLETSMSQHDGLWYMYYRDPRSASATTQALMAEIDRLLRASIADEAQAIREYPRLIVAIDQLLIDTSLPSSDLMAMQTMRDTIARIISDQSTHHQKFNIMLRQFEPIRQRSQQASQGTAPSRSGLKYAIRTPPYDWYVAGANGVPIMESLTEGQARATCQSFQASGQNVTLGQHGRGIVPLEAAGYIPPIPLTPVPARWDVYVDGLARTASVLPGGTTPPAGNPRLGSFDNDTAARQTADVAGRMLQQGLDPLDTKAYLNFTLNKK